MAAKQTLLFWAISACIVAMVNSQCKVDFVMILDGSGSICNNQGGTCANWLATLKFVNDVVDGMAIGPDDSRVALITFGSIGNLIWPLDKYTDKASLLAAINNVKYLDEKTNTSHALDLARTDVFGGAADRPGVPNVAIVLTDGLPSNITNPFVDGRGLARAAANRLKNSGVQVITIGVTEQIDAALLRDMSSPPQEKDKNYFTSTDFSKLDTIIDDIIEATCIVATTTAPPVVGSCLVDFGFLVDSSGSICNNKGGKNCINWASVRTFLQDVVRNMRIEETGSRVGMILFGSYATVLWQLNTHSTEAALVNAMGTLPFLDETTNTTYALQLARTHLFGSEALGDRPNVPNVAIILTDGKPTGDVASAATAAHELRESNVRIISIGVTHEISEDLLMNMSSYPRQKDQDYFTSPQFDKLNSLLLGIINSACPALTTTTPTTTTAQPDLTCRVELDIVVVLDASGSIRESNFEKAKAFLADTVGQLDITSGRTRVGLVTYGTDTSLRFHLSQYSSSNDVKQAILDTPYTHGTTNTAAALRYVSDTMFTSGNGDRSNVADLVVILTDGGSNDQEATVTQGLRLKAKGVHVLAVGIGNWLNKVELESIASHPDSRNVLYISSYDKLSDNKATFISFMCGTPTPCTSNPCQNGGSCRNHLDGIYMCHCPENYGGVNCQYRCMEPSDVVFALDASGSITSKNFKKVVDFAKNVVLDLPVDARMRVGLETFSTNERVYFNLKDYGDRSLLLNAMTIPYFSDGTTNTARALEVMRNDMYTSGNGDQSDVPNVGIVVTDGRSNNPRDTWAQAISTRNQNIDLIAIGVGGNIDNSELRAIASDPVDNNILIASNFDALDSLLSKVRDSVCKTPVCDSNPCSNGGTCHLLRNGYSCQCLQDWTGNTCERNCPGAADIVIALDVSGSIRQERFADILEYFVGVVENLEVYNDKVRVGALTFSDSATLQFRLNERSTRQDVIQSLRLTTYTGGKTNSADALKMAREELFIESRGDRQDAPNFLILFTDGAANIRAESTIDEAIESRIAGIHTIVIGIGKDLNYVEMESIASFPASENVKTVDSFTKINELSNYVELATCNSENECQNNPCQNGGTCTDALGYYLCTCQDDRTGKNCERDCHSQQDVVFLMDFSGSVDKTYKAIVAFMRETVYGLPFSFGRTRVAVLSYSDDVTMIFHLNKFSEQRDVLNAIAFYRNGGRTNTQEALRVARQTMLTSGNGDRSSVDNVVVLLTDGGSNIQRDMTSQRARELRDSPSTSLHVVAIGDRVDMVEVNDIVGGDSNRVYRMSDENAAASVANNLLNRIC